MFLAAGFCVSTILCQELQLPKTTHRHAIRRRSLQQDMPWGPRKTKKANSRYVGNRSAAVTRDQLFGNHATRSGVPQAVGNWHGLEHRRDGECPGPQKPIRTTKTRSEFGQVMEEEGFRVGVELGVKAGDFALVTLRAWKSSEEYWLVDLWAPQENYKDEANVDQRGHNAFHAKTMQKMKPFMSKVKVCRDYTTSCLKNFEDGSLDYVFVDARHDYKGALEDMENYWPKLRCGGILAGHDYMTQASPLRSPPHKCQPCPIIRASRPALGNGQMLLAPFETCLSHLQLLLGKWWSGDAASSQFRLAMLFLIQEEVSKHTQQDWTLNYDGTRDLTGRVVKGAVDDFAAKYHRQVVLTYREAAWNSWMIRK